MISKKFKLNSLPICYLALCFVLFAGLEDRLEAHAPDLSHDESFDAVHGQFHYVRLPVEHASPQRSGSLVITRLRGELSFDQRYLQIKLEIFPPPLIGPLGVLFESERVPFLARDLLACLPTNTPEPTISYTSNASPRSPSITFLLRNYSYEGRTALARFLMKARESGGISDDTIREMHAYFSLVLDWIQVSDRQREQVQADSQMVAQLIPEVPAMSRANSLESMGSMPPLLLSQDSMSSSEGLQDMLSQSSQSSQESQMPFMADSQDSDATQVLTQPD